MQKNCDTNTPANDADSYRKEINEYLKKYKNKPNYAEFFNGVNRDDKQHKECYVVSLIMDAGYLPCSAIVVNENDPPDVVVGEYGVEVVELVSESIRAKSVKYQICTGHCNYDAESLYKLISEIITIKENKIKKNNTGIKNYVLAIHTDEMYLNDGIVIKESIIKYKYKSSVFSAIYLVQSYVPGIGYPVHKLL